MPSSAGWTYEDALLPHMEPCIVTARSSPTLHEPTASAGEAKENKADETVPQVGERRFVDAFAGCGGLSLGLKRAGWRGLFAIEKDPFAFETLTANFSSDGQWSYDWPSGIERQAWDIEQLLTKRAASLEALAGEVELLAGGPPCQGFSCAGRRRKDDPRNALVDAYAELVKTLRPRLVLLENVRGFATGFRCDSTGAEVNFATAMEQALAGDYDVATAILRASDFGVPQVRPRFILVGAAKELDLGMAIDRFFDDLHADAVSFLHARGLSGETSAKDAISDLEIKRNGKVPSPDTRGFEATAYVGPNTAYQRAMHEGCDGSPSDMRLARHRESTAARFEALIEASREEGRLNVTVSKETKKAHGIKKAAIRVLDPLRPAPTVTSLPDDMIHYSEPRTLTVRENARLQSFPDWFSFRGKYTTGGSRRSREVPRFTQVANAVPPLLAEQLGARLMTLYGTTIESCG